jgi:hypothetical protein
MNVSLSPEVERLIREKVDSGVYASEGEVIAVAVRLLDDRDRGEAHPGREEPTEGAGPDFVALPFFGMAADRDDFTDSEAWVRRSREAWQQRASRSD